MITDKEIARINELYHKSKTEGLTPEEKGRTGPVKRRLYCGCPQKFAGEP